MDSNLFMVLVALQLLKVITVNDGKGYDARASLAALMAWPTWRWVCSAMWARGAITVVGRRLRPTSLGSVRCAALSERTTASACWRLASSAASSSFNDAPG